MCRCLRCNWKCILYQDPKRIHICSARCMLVCQHICLLIHLQYLPFLKNKSVGYTNICDSQHSDISSLLHMSHNLYLTLQNMSHSPNDKHYMTMHSDPNKSLQTPHRIHTLSQSGSNDSRYHRLSKLLDSNMIDIPWSKEGVSRKN